MTRMGLSPRVRGNLLLPVEGGSAYGSIPAGAGEPCQGAFNQLHQGLSPRVRGNHGYAHFRYPFVRSIPAGAGEPRIAPEITAMARVYPRGCGGTSTNGTRSPTSAGLSPRVRGNHQLLPSHCVSRRSIPAGAGEPPCITVGQSSTGVYPRGCGGTRGGRI